MTTEKNSTPTPRKRHSRAVAKPETAQPPVVITAITPMELLQRAMDSGADLDKLEQLMRMQERWEANDARKAFANALVEFKAEAPVINKDKRVTYKTDKGDTTYTHSTLGNVAEKLGPILSRHGLAYNYKTEQMEGGRVKVTCTLTHRQGHSESVSLEHGRDSSGGKNDIQALGSAISYLERYTLLAVTGVATGGDDDDGIRTDDEPETISDAQKAQLIEGMKETSTDTVQFLKYLNVDCLDNLLVVQLPRAVKALDTKRARMQEGGAK